MKDFIVKVVFGVALLVIYFLICKGLGVDTNGNRYHWWGGYICGMSSSIYDFFFMELPNDKPKIKQTFNERVQELKNKKGL